MEIRHEPPNPDTSFRVVAPLLVGFPDGDTLRVSHWSLRGLYDRRLAMRDLSGAILSIPFQGVGIYFPVSLVPGDAKDEFLFDQLNGRQRETLALFYRNLLSGRMSATEDIITSLDTPVDLVPMSETPTERRLSSSGMAPRSFRAIGHVAIYLVIAFLVFGYLGGLAWNRLTVIEVPMAHVTDTVADGGRTVLARVGPEHALDLWEGMAATVRFNDGGEERSVPARIQSVLADQGATDGGIWLMIVPLPQPEGAEVALPLPGTPVGVELSRRVPPAA